MRSTFRILLFLKRDRQKRNGKVPVFGRITICVVKGLQKTATIGDHKQEHIFVTSFDQLVDTAEKRIFGLRNKLNTMCDDIPGVELYKQAEQNYNYMIFSY